ncbi:hypothetical protein KY334_05335 [Candidatus Woesearchaeota archaeon]|nr:hypothetical protein [Candidatus Woesearchaeota archaeon]
MSWYGALFGFIWILIVFLFTNLWYWLGIFFLFPFRDLNMLWILVPIWINFIFTDYFQEKDKTSMGNAITNGAVLLWVGIDWIRLIVNLIADKTLGFSGSLILKIFLCIFIIGYGLFIIIEGIKGKEFVHFIGRVRETSYVLLVFTPIVYGVVDLTFKYFLTVLVFAPVFYYFFEMIDRITPNIVHESSDGYDNDTSSSSNSDDDFKF